MVEAALSHAHTHLPYDDRGGRGRLGRCDSLPLQQDLFAGFDTGLLVPGSRSDGAVRGKDECQCRERIKAPDRAAR